MSNFSIYTISFYYMNLTKFLIKKLENHSLTVNYSITLSLTLYLALAIKFIMHYCSTNEKSCSNQRYCDSGKCFLKNSISRLE